MDPATQTTSTTDELPLLGGETLTATVDTTTAPSEDLPLPLPTLPILAEAVSVTSVISGSGYVADEEESTAEALSAIRPSTALNTQAAELSLRGTSTIERTSHDRNTSTSGEESTASRHVMLTEGNEDEGISAPAAPRELLRAERLAEAYIDHGWQFEIGGGAHIPTPSSGGSSLAEERVSPLGDEEGDNSLSPTSLTQRGLATTGDHVYERIPIPAGATETSADNLERALEESSDGSHKRRRVIPADAADMGASIGEARSIQETPLISDKATVRAEPGTYGPSLGDTDEYTNLRKHRAETRTRKVYIPSSAFGTATTGDTEKVFEGFEFLAPGLQQKNTYGK